jgi:hypothetical protein
MLAERDRLLAEFIRWLDEQGFEPEGPFFLRLHTVDMAGEMYLEVGAPASAPGGARVSVGAIPAGEYAVPAYRNHSLQANRLLQTWAAEEGLVFDVAGSPAGDRWAARFDNYLTDPRLEPRKTR